jgi:hypothetical protein
MSRKSSHQRTNRVIWGPFRTAPFCPNQGLSPLRSDPHAQLAHPWSCAVQRIAFLSCYARRSDDTEAFLARVGRTPPTRATTSLAASVDPTEARNQILRDGCTLSGPPRPDYLSGGYWFTPLRNSDQGSRDDSRPNRPSPSGIPRRGAGCGSAFTYSRGNGHLLARPHRPGPRPKRAWFNYAPFRVTVRTLDVPWRARFSG